ncbi:hypothetical protein DPSP01_009139 [Paraphaeosphaeria sporulosa]|uniref:Uncharacterized protein n=1 Tax=Paraphaeosphaeria sporulosa TaxID=1460663 RepID=A0A177CKK1_9PLEO|nr:uncharacterized protein CC84DRAFT_1242855 [Paraphaeosphaeria sporulosa]OAG07369.1 hypothetical protein CC84DRAFT_1242855 [Paraphaeosphaeria sporulosa]
MSLYEDRPSTRNSGPKPSDYSPLAASNEYHDEAEKLLHPGLVTRSPSKCGRAWKWVRLALEIVGLSLLVSNTLMLLNYSQPVTDPDPRVSSGPANKHMMYGSDPRYMSFNHKYDYLWNDAFTESWGLIALPPFKDAAGLYSKDPVHDEGGIGMFHAFHCLASMRTAFQKMNESSVTLEQLQHGDHVAHCFDYLRNVVQCTADDTFELPRNRSGHPWGKIIEGQWDVRTCRDHTRLQEIMDKYGQWRRFDELIYHDEVGVPNEDPEV